MTKFIDCPHCPDYRTPANDPIASALLDAHMLLVHPGETGALLANAQAARNLQGFAGLLPEGEGDLFDRLRADGYLTADEQPGDPDFGLGRHG